MILWLLHLRSCPSREIRPDALFDDGDITYCPANNTAAIFYSQSSNPNLTMRIYPIGKVTSALSIFPDLPSRVEITFEIVQ